MPNANVFAAVAAALTKSLHTHVSPEPAQSARGGSINATYRWESASGPLFVKVASVVEAAHGAHRAMFEAEAASLDELARAQTVRVPAVRAIGETGGAAFLALEWIDLAPASFQASAQFGKALARLHRVTAEQFGWSRNNTIGGTPQINTPASDWTSFFREQRLRYQLELAEQNGYAGRLWDRGMQLLERLDALLAGHRPAPSLLHGDLWSGNFAADERGRPVIFDPAVYYGDREADLAMTRLFGGFGAGFYSAYEAEWPLPPGAAERVELYNLYHVLNHLNLFGGGYQGQAESLIERLRARAVGH